MSVGAMLKWSIALKYKCGVYVEVKYSFKMSMGAIFEYTDEKKKFQWDTVF